MPTLRASLILALLLAGAGCVPTVAQLAGRSVLPAATFAEGPTSGRRLGPGPVHGQAVPFLDEQPVQGFSALLIEDERHVLVMSDNGFGTLESSADYHLRVYRLGVDLEAGGEGEVEVLGFFELHDPDGQLPFTITNELSDERVLTGADLDIESFRRLPDGSFWFGDEFGPFLVHTDGEGRVLEPPLGLPDGDDELRSPQSPLLEEASAVRLMNAYEAQARRTGRRAWPVVSPHHLLVADDDPRTAHAARLAAAPPDQPSSELFDVASLQRAGYPVVPWTVNDPVRMRALIALGVDGIITDRPDLLRQVLAEYDADNDGAPDLLDGEGLVDRSRFDLQGHRGARGLRPENTLPAFEAALDNLATTLETDLGITADGVPVLGHDPVVPAWRCRRVRGQAGAVGEPLIRELTAAALQEGFVCDGLDQRFAEAQTSERTLSPVTSVYAREFGLPDPFVMPTLEQLFDFVAFYESYYRDGDGAGHSMARRRAANAARVRFNVEIKRDPTHPASTVSREDFVQVVGLTVVAASYEERVDVQSFDHASLLELQARFPAIRAAYLFDDETLRTNGEGRSPWLAGLRWPYGVTAATHSIRVQASGGVEGMALSPDGRRLLPLLEKPLQGDEARTLRLYELDLASRAFGAAPRRLVLDPRASSIGDFLLFGEARGLVLERDDAEGDLGAFKWIYDLTLGAPGEEVATHPLVDLMALENRAGLGLPGLPGDVGLGQRFAMPFFTIECLAVLGPRRLLVANDNNFPLSVGRHVGADRPDDNELILIALPPASALW